MPGKRSPRWLAMRSSSGDVPHALAARSGRRCTNRGSICGTLSARELLPPGAALRTRTDEVERQPRDVGERMRRVDRERHQHREDLAPEVVAQLRALVVGELVPRRRPRCRPRRVPGCTSSWYAAAWRSCSSCASARCRRAPPAARGRRSSARRGPVMMRRFRPATRTMKNSSRLLAKIARKFARSSTGQRRVLGELEHPLVERQPAQLAVEVAVGGQLGAPSSRTARSRVEVVVVRVAGRRVEHSCSIIPSSLPAAVPTGDRGAR